ncbi:MAG: RNA polymerase subunit sigma [Clostridiales bacterium]|nr:MAG: RNA polymerase subunit sigma [Clostridiales bacterium]
MEKQYEKHYKQLYRIAYSYLRHKQNAEDALQAAYEKAFENQKQLQDPKKLRSWLARIVINECNQNHRIRKRQTEIERKVEANSEFGVNSDYDISIELKDAMLLLSEEDRNLISLKYLLGYRQKEIADILDLPVGTVKSRLSRSLGKLREIMGGGDNE